MGIDRTKEVNFIDNFKETTDWFYLLGAYLSDGNIQHQYKRNDTYHFRLETIDIEFAKEVEKSINNITDLNVSIKVYNRKEKRFKNKFYQVNVRRKLFCKEILKIFPNKQRLDIIKFKNKKQIISFLNGFFDGDGTIDKNGHAYIIQKGLDKIIFLQQLFKRINIETTINRSYTTNINKLRISNKHSDILKQICTIPRKRLRIKG
jgi:intein/homing endonuclease